MTLLKGVYSCNVNKQLKIEDHSKLTTTQENIEYLEYHLVALLSSPLADLHLEHQGNGRTSQNMGGSTKD